MLVTPVTESDWSLPALLADLRALQPKSGISMVVWSVPKGDMVAVAPAAPRSALVYLHTVFVSQKARPPI